MRPYLRYLRITWTVFYGIACVLLCALWVRSYWWADYFNANNTRFYKFYVETQRGELFLDFGPPPDPSSSWIDYGRLEVERYFRNFDYTLLGFYFGNDEMFPGTFIIDLPFWFLIPITTALAAAPWLSWRFSLRALLIATTLVAVVLWLIVWTIR